MKKIMKKLNKKGFTLAELLIVVAIIAVLVAISIPIFTSQLEKSREATDAANLRAKYAEVMTCALTGQEDTVNGITVTTGADGTITVVGKVDKAQQKQADWQNSTIEDIGGVEIISIPATTLNGWTITYTESDGKIVFAETT